MSGSAENLEIEHKLLDEVTFLSTLEYIFIYYGYVQCNDTVNSLLPSLAGTSIRHQPVNCTSIKSTLRTKGASGRLSSSETPRLLSLSRECRKLVRLPISMSSRLRPLSVIPMLPANFLAFFCPVGTGHVLPRLANAPKPDNLPKSDPASRSARASQPVE